MSKKISVITGGSSGFGLAAARCLSSETALLLCARGTAGLEKTKKELESFGAEVYMFSLDVSDPASVENCAKYAASLGDVANVIHAAGVSPANTSAEDIMRINIKGPVNIVKSFYPVMAADGVMILFGSTGGYTIDTTEALMPLIPVLKNLYENWNAPDFSDQLLGFLHNVMKPPKEAAAGMAYCISKHFVRQFVYANAWRFARRGCRILSISPGSYLTPMHQALIDNQPETAVGVMQTIPLQRWGHPYEMGKLVEFLCSKGAGYITGVDILADGGCTYPCTVKNIE